MGTNSLLLSIAGVPKILSDFIPDNGLAILAASLKDNGHSVRILDTNTTSTLEQVFDDTHLSSIKTIAEKIFIEKRKPSILDMIRLKPISNRLEKRKDLIFDKISDDICREIKKNCIDFVGMKLWAGDGFKYSLDIARNIKRKFPQIKIFGGGPQVDIFQEEIFKVTDSFDALCFGDGEETINGFADFVAGKTQLDTIPNIIFRKNGKIIKNQRRFVEDLSTLPIPEYHQDIYTGIGDKIKMFVVDESRGCPNYCAFCIHPVKSGKLREKPVSRIIGELENFISEYGVRVFRYAGSNTPGDLLEKTSMQVIDRGLNIAYTTFGHFDSMKDVDFNIVRKSGCMSIFFGLESASPEILNKAMHKKNSPDVMESVIISCKNARIFTVVSVIYPSPFETDQTRKQTMDFILKTRPDSVLIQFPGLYPGTVWGKNPSMFNFTVETDNYAEDIMTYQIKQLFPPRYWKPLPYKVNGMDFRQYAGETERFQKELCDAGITTFVSDEAYLLSRFSGFKSMVDFVDYNRYFLFAGLAGEIRKEINVINENISQGIE